MELGAALTLFLEMVGTPQFETKQLHRQALTKTTSTLTACRGASDRMAMGVSSSTRACVPACLQGDGSVASWGALDDVVMGGVSSSTISSVPGAGEGGQPAMVFR